MKKVLLSLFLLSGSIAWTAAQDAAQPAEAADPNAPEITFDEEVHDFGTIPFDGNGKFDFKFSNTGKSPLVISSAKGSCGCTVPQWPKEPVKKGESSVINVSYDTKRVGPFTKTVTINSNAKTPVKVITIKGKVMSKEESESLTPFNRGDKSGMPLENTSTK